MGSGAVVRARQFGCKRFGVYKSYSFGTQQISVNFEKVLPLSSQAVRDNDFANAEVANQSLSCVFRPLQRWVW